MAITRLKRKHRKNIARANNKQRVIKQLLTTPIIKNVDVEELKSRFGSTTIAQVATTVKESVKETAKTVASKVEDVVETVKSKVEDVVEAVKDKVEDITSSSDAATTEETAAPEAPVTTTEEEAK